MAFYTILRSLCEFTENVKHAALAREYWQGDGSHLHATGRLGSLVVRATQWS